jgi:hypothetical protein
MVWKDIGVILAEMKKSGATLNMDALWTQLPRYSDRKATIGSTFVARLAGM